MGASGTLAFAELFTSTRVA